MDLDSNSEDLSEFENEEDTEKEVNNLQDESVENPETFQETENEGIEDPIDESENLDEGTEDQELKSCEEQKVKLYQLPFGRVKNIIKSDPEVNLIGQDAVFAITKATVSILSLKKINLIYLIEYCKFVGIIY